MNGDIPFRNRLFPEKIENDDKIIDVLALIDDEEKFSKVSDEDAIRLCLLLSLEVIFMGRELVSVVDDVLLRMVDNLDAWNTFPWGEHIWRQLYDSIRNVSSKHKLEHLDGLRKNPNHVPSYSLSGFLFAFKIWIIESSCESDRWWTKVPELIPRAVAWTRKAEFFKLEYFGELFHKAPIELAPTKAEFQSNWYTPSYDFFMWYAPRSPPVSIGGLYGEYLNKRSATRAAKQKDSGEFHPGLRGRQKGREAALIDRVRDLEGLCESLLTLPKEVKSLRGRIFKLESIIQVITLKTNRIEKDESLNKFGPQIKDLLKSTSEDEPDIRDNTSKIVEKDVLMPTNPVSQPIYGDFSSDLAVLNGFCNLSENEDDKGDCEIIRLADQRQHDDISKMANEAEQQIESEIQRLYDHREASMEQLANQKNVLNPLMIEKCKSVKSWMEDLKRSFNRIDRIFLSHDLEEWLSQFVVGRFDEHIELWIMYMWHTRPSDMDWAMVSRYFPPLLLQGSMPKFYANNAIYPVFIPINEPKRHWSLAMFHICSGIVTFYDSEKSNATHDKEFRQWYLKKRQCLEEKIPIVIKETSVFEKKNIDPAKYKIFFRHANHVPKQGEVFGDCGVFLCMFLYRLAYGVPLAVDDPVQAALAYREKMIRFYFQHKMFCP
ncbi:phospholipase-like protein [Tanacetum coccineum]